MKTSRVFTSFLSVPFILSASVALGQDQSDDDSAEGVLEEVMVTASRRGEADIMTTPISITALDGEAVQNFAIRDLNDIAVQVPGAETMVRRRTARRHTQCQRHPASQRPPAAPFSARALQ